MHKGYNNNKQNKGDGPFWAGGGNCPLHTTGPEGTLVINITGAAGWAAEAAESTLRFILPARQPNTKLYNKTCHFPLETVVTNPLDGKLIYNVRLGITHFLYYAYY
jgi:hypothetical protein